MGLIVNKPAEDILFSDVVGQLDVTVKDCVRKTSVYFGGPVEAQRGFVLHSKEYQSSLQTLNVGEDFGMTATLDVLEDMAQAQGPARAQLMLGYAGWGAGQLENEIVDNGWLICDATPALVFEGDNSTKWSRALAALGIDPLSLSATAGHA